MKKVMDWLRSGKHRVIAAVVITLLLVTCAASAQTPDLKILYAEPATMIRFGDANQAGTAVCLENKSESRDGLPEGWDIYSCNDVNSPLNWHLCYINVDKASFICGVKPS